MVNQKARHKFACLSTVLATLGYKFCSQKKNLQWIKHPQILFCINHSWEG